MVYSLKQLLRAIYHDGQRFCCLSALESPNALLEKEAQAVDSFMHGLRDHHHEHGLTRQYLTDCFECSSPIPETHIIRVPAPDGNEEVLHRKLVIRAGFLALCQQVAGLLLPATACKHDTCNEMHKVFKKGNQSNMKWGFYRASIENPNNFDSEYDCWCDSKFFQ